MKGTFWRLSIRFEVWQGKPTQYEPVTGGKDQPQLEGLD